MKILVINGPNLNMLGIREPKIYGTERYWDLCAKINDYAKEKGVEVEIYQSNHEGDLVDAIQKAYGDADGIVLNPAAYTHTSIAILDAVKAVGEQRNLPVMDMYNITFDQLTEGFFNDSAHPNKYGNQVMGDALQKWLEENIDIVLK